MACETPKNPYDKLKEMYMGSEKKKSILNSKGKF